MTKTGRPPLHFTDQQAEKIGEELVAWTRSEAFKKCVHINEFWLNRKDITPNAWKALAVRPVFLEYYEHAQKAMAVQIIKNRDVRDSVCNRYLCFYDRDLFRFEEENRDREAARHKPNSENVSPEYKQNLDQLTQFFARAFAQAATQQQQNADQSPVELQQSMIAA